VALACFQVQALAVEASRQQAALFATTREAKDYRVEAENTCIDSGLMTRPTTESRDGAV
ncbi:hypothetical protein Tco_1267727, partial [Tanacetum coccineum]